MLQKKLWRRVWIAVIVLPALLVTLSSFYMLAPAGAAEPVTAVSQPYALTRQAQEYSEIDLPGYGRQAAGEEVKPLWERPNPEIVASVNTGS